MKILVIGGTRYFGIHMVNKLLEQGHEVTIATRGKTPDSYGDKVERIKHNFRQLDALPYAKEGTLEQVLDELYPEQQ